MYSADGCVTLNLCIYIHIEMDRGAGDSIQQSAGLLRGALDDLIATSRVHSEKMRQYIGNRPR